jgi:hypothetical protein
MFSTNDLERYNGRVNIIQPPDQTIQFKMFEKINVANVATDYRGAIAGVFEDNVLAQVYFSAGNIQILQNGLRAGVYAMSNEKYVIPNQNITNLKIIMRSTYLQYAEHSPNNVTKEVERLNKMVLDYCVPSVFNEALGYERYCQDQSSLVVPLSMPQPSDRDYKQLEQKHFM